MNESTMNEIFDKTMETTSTPLMESIETNTLTQLSENAKIVDDIIERLESGQWKFNDKIDLNPLSDDEFGKIVDAANKSPHDEHLTFTNLPTFTEGMAKKTITFEKFNPNGEALEEFKKAMNSLSNINSKSTGISFNFPDFDTDDVNFVKTLTEKKLLDRSIGIKDPSPEMITALMTRNVIDEETGEVLDTHYSPFLTLPRLENLSKESATKLLEYTNLLKGKYPGTNDYPTIELGLNKIPEDFASNEEYKAMWKQLLHIPGCLRLPNITSIPDNLAIGIKNFYAEGAFLQLPKCTLTPGQKEILNEASRRIQAQGFEKK